MQAKALVKCLTTGAKDGIQERSIVMAEACRGALTLHKKPAGITLTEREFNQRAFLSLLVAGSRLR